MKFFTSKPFLSGKYPLLSRRRDMFVSLIQLNIFRKPIIILNKLKAIALGEIEIFTRILNEHILKLNNLLRLSAFLLISCIVPLASTQAQDIHFSQYYNSPLTTNPALTGIFAGDLRINGILRSQWDEANTPYRTIHLAGDGKLFNPRNTKGFFSIGGQIYRDEAGDSNLSNTSIAANGSYTRSLDRENFVSFGIYLGAGQRKFENQDLTWNNQFSGDAHNPDLGSGEDFDRNSRIFADLGAGINWHGKKMKRRSTMDIGVAFFHINTPNQSFYNNDKAKMPMRISLYILPTIQISENFDIVLNGNAQLQDKYTELLGGGALRYHLNTKKTKKLALQLGGGMRFNSIGDALVIGAELHHRYMQVGFTYDLNVSKFKEATNRNGGPELTARYTIHKVHPLKYRKLCPLL